MTDIQQRARDALNEAISGHQLGAWTGRFEHRDNRANSPAIEAMCRQIEAHDATKAEFEAHKREVSKAVKVLAVKVGCHSVAAETLIRAATDRFILPEPVDQLVEAVASINDEMIQRIADSKDVASCRNAIRAALIACGLTITEQQP